MALGCEGTTATNCLIPIKTGPSGSGDTNTGEHMYFFKNVSKSPG